MVSKEILKEYHEYGEANILDKAEEMYKDGYLYDVELALSIEKIKYDKVLKDLDRLEKLEKAIDIIKLLYISTYEEKENGKSVYELYCVGKGVYITKEEYELLKEVLIDENC